MLDELFELFDRDRRGQPRDGAQPPKKGIRGFFARMLGGGDHHDDAPRNGESYAAAGRDRNRDDDDDDPRNDERHGRSGRGRRRDDDGPDFGLD